MVRLLIHRGHDGPARKGTIDFADGKVEVPTLLGPLDSIHTGLKMIEIAQLPISDSAPSLVSTGTFLESNPSLLNEVPVNSFVLLPSLPGIPGLGGSIAKTIVESQIQFLADSAYPGPSIIRIPSSMPPEDLEDLIPTMQQSQVIGASFLFNDELGKHDLNNIALRSKMPRNWLAIALGRIRPSVLPILYYAGFDIIDISYGLERATRLVRLSHLSQEQISAGQTSRFCPCVHCSRITTDTNTSELESIISQHNQALYGAILSESKEATRTGSLRWLVESSTHGGPNVLSYLRMADAQNYSFFEEFTPTGVSFELPLIGPESYNAPQVRRYREYVKDRYSPPTTKKIVVLLPCSARKPYSESKTHRRFSHALDRTLGSRRDSVAETIITSPLGIVPRELERSYPSANYDIPVTGDWDAEETSIAAEALIGHLMKFSENTPVVAHVSGGYLSVVKLVEDQIRQSLIYTTHDASPTSASSLMALSETLSDLSELYPLSGKRSALEDTLRATADYQFGSGAGEALVPDGAKVGGKVYGTIICRSSGVQTCSFAGATGQISLTLDGAKRIGPLNRYWVRFEGVSIEGSSIFAIGINSAYSGIRPGDEVIILNSNDDVIATGRSEMSGREMCDFDNGVAVKVRHKER